MRSAVNETTLGDGIAWKTRTACEGRLDLEYRVMRLLRTARLAFAAPVVMARACVHRGSIVESI